MEGWPEYWERMIPMHYATHVVSPVLGLVNGFAEYVSCFGSGTINERLAEKSGNPHAVESCHIKIKDSDVAAHIWRFLFDTARQYRESFDVYGTKKSFEWALVEGEEHVVHTAKKPEPEIPERVSVPDFAHLLPEEIRPFTTTIQDAAHLSFIQGGGTRRLASAPGERVPPRPAGGSRSLAQRGAIANWTCTGILRAPVGHAGGEIVRCRSSRLSALLNQQNKDASNLLKSLIDDRAMTLDAIRGYAIVENKDAPTVLLERFPKLEPEQQRAVIETLAARKTYAESLLQALKKKQISRDAIPTQVARSLSDMLGTRFTTVFGTVRAVAEDREQLLAKYKELCNPTAIAAADASRGRAVFQRTCAACHTLYGEGGNVGPDLTGSNRANLDYILLNSVDPSYDVPDAYKTISVLTVDGRTVNGVLAEEDSTRIVLKTAEQPRVVIAKEDIEIRQVSPKSMMPDGQLEQMKEQEVIDLIKYLRTTEQVEMAK
jgi:putative heme-binding domain-containing protein